MELHLRIEVAVTSPTTAHVEPSRSADVVARVERSHTVGQLSAALVRQLGQQLGLEGGSPTLRTVGTVGELGHRAFGLARVCTGEVLDPAFSLERVGLLSGERLAFTKVSDHEPSSRSGVEAGVARRVRPPPQSHAVALGLLVASGPDVGTSADLSPSLEIGRDRSCGLVLSDPTVSRRHLTITLDGSEVIVSPSSEARAAVLIDGTVIDEPTPITEGDIIRIGATTLTLVALPPEEHPPRGRYAGRLGTVAFQRTPYYPAPVQEQVFAPLGAIPERPEPPRFAYLAALAPLLFGVTMAFVYSPRMLMFAVFSPIMAGAAYVESRRRTSFRFGEGLDRYRRKLETRRLEIEAAFAAERERRHRSAPHLAELARRASDRSPDLWIRGRHAADHLELRIGLGDLSPSVVIQPETRGDESLRDELERELACFDTICDVPITVDLTEQVVVALVGRPADTSSLASSMVLQAASLHSPEDLVLVVAVSGHRELGSWVKWIPHIRSASSPLSGPHLVTTAEAAQVLLTALLAVAEQRLADRDRTIDRRWPRLLVVVDHALEPEAALVSRLLDGCGDSGISVVWLTDGSDRVPRQASAVVNCSDMLGPNRSTLVHTDPAIDDVEVEIERSATDLADTAARSLAAVRDASSATGSNSLPHLVTMHSAFRVDEIDERWVERQWAVDRGHSLPTPIGMCVEGPFVIDLIAHGPHALIGGTSGSGKSELLMAMVAGLIAFNSPAKVNVLFVDYKGGASSDVFRSAPHTVGYVTNLDVLLARRALTSLRAELNRRMKLLQGRAKDLTELIERHPDEAPPSLVIVVDEFATLAKEVPEFVSGIVDIAQRGRSLGIHLILATQRPSGAVNDNILANTNLRMSLRVLDSAESNSVIGTSDAAAIPNPLKGRAFARVGPGELVAFQSAWTAAPSLGAKGPPPIVVEHFGDQDGGEGSAIGGLAVVSSEASEGTEAEASGVTQLEMLLAAIDRVAVDHELTPGRSPWLDELPTTLDLDEVLVDTGLEPERPGWAVTVGLVDDPQAQAQYPAVVDLERGGGLAVFGTGGSGKTTALTTIALSAAIADSQQGGGSLTIFGLDFASRELASLAKLPQCAAIASGDDLESVTRVIGLLDGLLDRRRDQLADAARRGDEVPRFCQVLLLIDDYGNLAQSFEGAGATTALYRWLEALNRVIVDGRQVGVCTAMSAARRAVVKASLLSAISNRIVLRQADSGGYAELGLPSSLTGDLELVPGRGFYNGANLLQVAKVRDQVEFVARLHGSVDAELATAPLPAHIEPLAPSGEAMHAAVGLADLSGEPVIIDLSVNNLAVVGDPRSGRSNALATIGRQLTACGHSVWAVGPGTSPLSKLISQERAGFGSMDAVIAALDALVDFLEHLQPDDIRPVLLIDDADLLDEPRFEPVMARLCSLGCRWVASTVSLRGYSTNQLIQDMKKARSILHLQPADAREVQETTGCQPLLRPGLAMPPGRGVLVQNRVATVMQTAWNDGATAPP